MRPYWGRPLVVPSTAFPQLYTVTVEPASAWPVSVCAAVSLFPFTQPFKIELSAKPVGAFGAAVSTVNE